jgi:spore germination protein YaaH
MNIMKQKLNIPLVILFAIIVEIPVTLSIPDYVAPLQSTYNNGSCTTCHIMYNGGDRNDYGTFFENQPNHDIDSIAALRAIGPPNSQAQRLISKEIQGYYSLYSSSDDWSNIRFDIISTLVLYNVAPLADGNFRVDYDADIPDRLITRAHNNGVNVIFSFGPTIGDAHVIDSILGDEYSKNNAIDNILGLIQRHNFDGVDIDIEGINPRNSITGTSNKILMTNFIRDLRSKLDTVDPNYRIHIAIGSYYQHEDQIFDLGTLQKYVNYIMMMGYDYAVNTAGPNAPIDAYNKDPSISGSIYHYTSFMDKNKFLLGVPWYGYEWPTKTGDLFSPITGGGTTNSYQTMQEKANQFGRLWDDIWKTPWYRYQSGNQWYQGHYDDIESLGIKYDLVNSQGLAGIGIWQLGYGNDNPEMWQLLQDKFKN